MVERFTNQYGLGCYYIAISAFAKSDINAALPVVFILNSHSLCFAALRSVIKYHIDTAAQAL